MASDWIKWVKGLSRRREVIALARKLSMSCREAACACMEVWEWADSETIDGHVRGVCAADIDLMVGIPGFSDALEAAEVGWVKINAQGITFQKWERHNGESAKRRATESKKKRRQRASNVSPKNRDKCPANVPDSLLFSSPLPSVLDSDLFRSKFMEWLKYKRARGQNYVEQGLNAMIARASNLATDNGLQSVIDSIDRAMANNWQGWDHPAKPGSAQQAKRPRQRVRLSDDNG
jgi:hypothetical protein